LKAWLVSLLSDSHNGSVSSKRAITLFAFLLCSASFIGELLWNTKVTSQTFDSMMYIVIAGLGFTASEKFTKKEEK
jgi:hypothetical protein